MYAEDFAVGDTLDTRDLDKLLDELEGEDDESLDEDDLQLREDLQAVRDAGIADYQYGEALIREDYFKEYAQDLAEDIGAIDPDASWPLNYIDWDAAADALKQDYAEVEILGITYYVRA